jgi:ABC-type branched-subunit amino acid transport system substrate-binding protein
MERERLAALLRDADAAVATARAEIERQLGVIAGVEAQGKDASDARDTLQRLELAERLYRQQRDRLSEDLSK